MDSQLPPSATTETPVAPARRQPKLVLSSRETPDDRAERGPYVNSRSVPAPAAQTPYGEWASPAQQRSQFAATSVAAPTDRYAARKRAPQGGHVSPVDHTTFAPARTPFTEKLASFWVGASLGGGLTFALFTLLQQS